MRPTVLVGIILIIVGIFFISYDYIPSHRERQHIGIGPIELATVEEEEGSNPAPLFLGAIAIIAGLVLVLRRS